MQINENNVQIKFKKDFYFLKDVSLKIFLALKKGEIFYLGNKFGFISFLNGELVCSEENKVSSFCKSYLESSQSIE
jgi:hypothetical protein